MKVIFLDLDGVLNSRAYDRTRNWAELTYIDETRLELVKEIVDATDAKIVFTSTWRADWDKDPSLRDEDGRYIADTFARYGLEIYDKTPDLGLNADRGDEIREWLKSFAEKVDSFVIIDDFVYDWGDMTDNFVKTSQYVGRGLEAEHVQKAIRILNGCSANDKRETDI